jgi:predicted transcriptional regulator
MTNNQILMGLHSPASLQRRRHPNAKDDLRRKARELRAQGMSYAEIVAELGVAKSSVSLWVRDLPRPERYSGDQLRKRRAEATARYWAEEKIRREKAKAEISGAAMSQIGHLSKREAMIAGVIAYWCEGTKNKPHRRSDRVAFSNSDPRMISFFLRFLDTTGVPRDDLAFQLGIHENSDVEAAQRFWCDVTEADPAQFTSPTLKAHNPITIRKNTGDSYQGCLRITVYRSSELYRQIEGWAAAIMNAPRREGGCGHG